MRSPAALLALLLACAPAWADFAGRAPVAAFGLWSDQGVFLSEATQAAAILSKRFGHGAPVIVRANSRRRAAASPPEIDRALKSLAARMDMDRDVAFILLTSHGSPEGLAEKAGSLGGTLPPDEVADLLARSAIRDRVLIVSACYSGIFLPLADPHTLVITAADATHPSFGCQEGARWTYFGEAFFAQAMRAGAPLPETFADAAARVRARELREGFDPSNPQIAGGAEVLRKLSGAAPK